MFGIALKRRRRAVAAVCYAVFATAIAGCGGGVPTNASVKEFCKAGATFAKANRFDAGVKAAERMHDTGTPKGIPADARDGFELVVALITEAKDQADLERRYKKLTDSERKAVQALDSYITATC